MPVHDPNLPPAGLVGPARPVAPSQVRFPSRTTLRTVFQALVAVCAMVPVLVATTGLKPEQVPWLGGIVAVAAVVTRLMATPQLEGFLRRFLPFLAAAPTPVVPAPAPVADVPDAPVRKPAAKKAAAKRPAKKAAPKSKGLS